MDEKFKYLFGEALPFEEGEEVIPGTTIKRVLRCTNCILPDKMRDSIYCADKRYWIEENANDVIAHCKLLEIPKNEETFLLCENLCLCEACCEKDCIGKE